MRSFRHEPQHLHNRRRQWSLARNLARKFSELLETRQLAVQQQVGDFLEAGLLRHFVNVVAAIHQTRVRVDPADLRLARDHSGQTGTVGWFCFGSHLGASLYTRNKHVQRPTFNAESKLNQSLLELACPQAVLTARGRAVSKRSAASPKPGCPTIRSYNSLSLFFETGLTGFLQDYSKRLRLKQFLRPC